MHLSWLPVREDWDVRLQAAAGLPAVAAAVALRELATSRLEFAQMGKLDRVAQRALAAHGGTLPGLEPVRLAVLGSATTSHLSPGIRVAGLRRGLAIEVYEAPYGLYWQQLMVPGPELSAFHPKVVLLALDARHVAAWHVAANGVTPEQALETMRACWRQARAKFGCVVLQQTVLPVFDDLLGNNEARLAHSPAAVVARLNELLRPASDAEGVELLALDRFAANDGIREWYEPGMWHRSKHEVHPRATQVYGDHVARLIAAARGRSAKCLVLDLDNTLWGGVIGDDGMEGIVLGQGSGDGEAYAEVQRYAKGLAGRGILLAVNSKNDADNALEPFSKHPEMVLRRDDIACFVANWTDKAANLRHIAATLHIGLDAMVFVDDSPVERELVRRELPMVAVPEMPDDPAEFVATLAAAGYFEGLRLTEEDRERGRLYRENAARQEAMASVPANGATDPASGVTDMAGYLQSLRMVLTVLPVDAVGLVRVTQLINKTNQFNLTTQRLSEAEVAACSQDPRRVCLQVRLADRFGDSGIIAVLIARLDGTDAVIETWLMSCRVLARRVEEGCLNVLAELCRELGAERLVGLYRPTDKNTMVREMYPRLGFSPLREATDGEARWALDLKGFQQLAVPMQVETPRAVGV